MAWSNINEAYKIQNFNSEQGKRFYAYRMTDPTFETYNIMEGFNSEVEQTSTQAATLAALNTAQTNYIGNKDNNNHYIGKNIFVDRNDDFNESRKCVPVDTTGNNASISGSWVTGVIPVKKSIAMGNQIVYMIQDGGYTKMVQWPSNINKYYTGLIDSFNVSEWDTYITAPNGVYILNISKYYNSQKDAILACKYKALNNSPQHSAYSISAYQSDSDNNYKYLCTTGNTGGDLYSNFNSNIDNDKITKINKTLYKFKPKHLSSQNKSKFVLSPTSQTYDEHNEICKKSNGKWSMASITSLEDHTAINKIIRLNADKIPILEDNHRWVATGGHRISNNSSIWVWEDGTPWNDDIANGTTINGCGWQPGRPNDYGGISNILWVSDTGSWGDAPSVRSSYAIYKEVVYSDEVKVEYAASFNNDGTLSFDVRDIYPDGSGGQNRRTNVRKTYNNITLPLPIAGCSPLTGGELNKDSVNLKYKYNCNA